MKIAIRFTVVAIIGCSLFYQGELHPAFAANAPTEPKSDTSNPPSKAAAARTRNGLQAHDRTFYWTFKDEDAIRIGDMKLRMKNGQVLGLFDLAADPDEEHNLALARPRQVSSMRSMQAKWKAQCEAQQTSTAQSG